MDPCSPKLASKIPRRRPSTQLNPSLQPPVSPTKLHTQIATSPPQPPLSAHNTWPPPALSSQSQSQSSTSNPMIQDRRRTRTRTRTQSTDLSQQSTEYSPPSHSPSRPLLPPPPNPSEDPRRFPPLSIHIPSSHSPQSQRTRSTSNAHSKPSPSQFSPTSQSHSYSFTPRTRQPSLPYSSLRTPHTPHTTKPPMSERPRVISSSTRHERTTTTSSNPSNQLMTPATYESFDFPIPATPDEEREERRLIKEWETKRGRFCGLGRIWTRELLPNGANNGERVTIIGERTRLLLGQEEESEGKEELGKWEYVWGEIVCYAKHMLPPVILFVLIALSIALFIYNKEVGRIIRGRFPDQEEEP